jgi:hypothetical protein
MDVWRLQDSQDTNVISDRYNIVVIANETYRSQYDLIGDFAKHMHNALPKVSFILSLTRRLKAATKCGHARPHFPDNSRLFKRTAGL